MRLWHRRRRARRLRDHHRLDHGENAAGAAKQLHSALLVNPHDIEAMARAIKAALAMPRDERLSRWTAMMDVMEASSLTQWFSTYVAALKATERMSESTGYRTRMTLRGRSPGVGSWRRGAAARAAAR